tara:strand:- start:67461 stop:67889 length:429 start_codon:yes stop_codon:yes gene_type:complete
VIRFEVIRPDPGFSLTLEEESGEVELECPFSVPLFFAQNCRKGDLMLWLDVETNVVGIFAGDRRVAWRHAMIARANIAILHPAKGQSGVVGFEVGLREEAGERPVFAVDEYSREILDWFKLRRSALNEYFGVEVAVKDYGTL